MPHTLTQDELARRPMPNMTRQTPVSAKHRDNWATGLCLKQCANRDNKCEACLRFSEYVPVEDKA